MCPVAGLPAGTSRQPSRFNPNPRTPRGSDQRIDRCSGSGVAGVRKVPTVEMSGVGLKRRLGASAIPPLSGDKQTSGERSQLRRIRHSHFISAGFTPQSLCHLPPSEQSRTLRTAGAQDRVACYRRLCGARRGKLRTLSMLQRWRGSSTTCVTHTACGPLLQDL